jgi:hypothetical protein
MAQKDAVATLPEYRWRRWRIHSLGALAQAFGVPCAVRR